MKCGSVCISAHPVRAGFLEVSKIYLYQRPHQPILLSKCLLSQSLRPAALPSSCSCCKVPEVHWVRAGIGQPGLEL